MKNILAEIKAHKIQAVKTQLESCPVALLRQSKHYNAAVISMKKYIKRTDKSGIIAEFKRKSPSKSNINLYADPEQISIGYMQAGAAALSVLTDSNYFGGSNQDLITARSFNYCPILRKDFIVNTYQIEEARSIGADAILLIAAILTKEEVKNFTNFAHELGLEVLLEIHEEREIEKLYSQVDLIGVNNRNLDNFEVDFDRSASLINQLPLEIIKIAESGIQTPKEYFELRKIGFDGGLIGERFMKNSNPALACRNFIEEFKLLSHGVV